MIILQASWRLNPFYVELFDTVLPTWTRNERGRIPVEHETRNHDSSASDHDSSAHAADHDSSAHAAEHDSKREMMIEVWAQEEDHDIMIQVWALNEITIEVQAREEDHDIMNQVWALSKEIAIQVSALMTVKDDANFGWIVTVCCNLFNISLIMKEKKSKKHYNKNRDLCM
jgi:nuclear transport factor 2 (NTF2) superfamily protein